jgi:hypothetical protein
MIDFNTTTIQMKFKDHGLLQWGLFLVVVVGMLVGLYYPAIMQQAALQWDATEIYLPWKYFLNRQVHDGVWPLWNPYMSGGFPQHGDPGTWYEISYLFALDGCYDLQSLLYEQLFHLLVAATGMFALARLLKSPKGFDMAIGLGYALNGFFMGNAQHMGWVIGFAWMPWMIWGIQSLLLNIQNRSSSIGLAVFVGVIGHFQFVGGYLGVSAICLYVLVVVWCLHLFQDKENRRWLELINQFKLLCVTLMVFVLLSLPALLSFWDLQSQITRGGQLKLSDAQFGHWPLQAWYTLFGFQPNSTCTAAWGADISLVNIRWGCVSVILLFGTMIFRKPFTSKQWIHTVTLILLALSCLLIASGKQLPFFQYTVYQWPLLKLFRFPSLYRGLALFLLSTALIYSLRGYSPTTGWALWVLPLLMILESGWGAMKDRDNTVLVKIPAYEVNQFLRTRKSDIDGQTRNLPKSLTDSVFSDGLPTSTEVDNNRQWNEMVPFMNQNQGVYLGIWARDGYNPYQLMSRSMANYSPVSDKTPGIVGLDDHGKVVRGGVRLNGYVKTNGEGLWVEGLTFDDEVRDMVILQTPSRHWRLKVDGRDMSLNRFGEIGIRMSKQANFSLTYSPYYFNTTVKVIWVLSWLFVLFILIFNGIGYLGWGLVDSGMRGSRRD